MPTITSAFRRVLSTLPWRRRTSATTTTPTKLPHWSIGIYAGESPFALMPPDDVDNPVLTCADVTDVPASFVADPFMVRTDGVWYMFFEVMAQHLGIGQIGLAISHDGLVWKYQRIVLAEPYHLSYPYVFEWMKQYYMIPESYIAGSVRLYKAVKFPTEWVFVKTLLSGPHYADSSIFRHESRWWMFTESSLGMKHDSVRLFYADDLEGLWLEHPRSPVVENNPHLARPSGRVLVINKKPIRYAQDCFPTYGTQVRAFEITELTTENYQERQIGDLPLLTGSGSGWNKDGMHHIDPHPIDENRWIACVDGWHWDS
jgi:hypothetical protein